MNTLLLVADSDPRAVEVMLSAIRTGLRPARIHVLEPDPTGLPITDPLPTDPTRFEDLGPDHYRVPDTTLLDLVDLAHLHSEIFLPPPATWDRVFIGLSSTPVTGTPDIVLHPSLLAGIRSYLGYRTPTHVMVQIPAPGDDPHLHAFDQAGDAARHVMAQYPEDLVLTNLPGKPSLGHNTQFLHHYSSLRLPSPSIVPRAKDEKSARTSLDAGYITHSRLQLRVNPELRY
jgi:hypothetical protein